MNTPTPETDAELKRNSIHYGYVRCDFTRKLELERDAARDRAYKAESYLAEAEQGFDVFAERDQLRAVCDAFASEHCRRTGIDGAFDDCLAKYRALPHVKAEGELL